MAPGPAAPLRLRVTVGIKRAPSAQPFYRATLIYGIGFADLQTMSALPPKADIAAERDWHVNLWGATTAMWARISFGCVPTVSYSNRREVVRQ
jgi:hypothetical protein